METNNKLREALTKILNLTNSLDENCAVDPVDICDIARAALAEPMRNCDVGTAEEQGERFHAFCKSNKQPGDVYSCDRCKLNSIEDCELAWAQMPYSGNDKVHAAVSIMGRESLNKQCWECANCKEPTAGWDGSKFRCAFLGKDFGTWHYDVPNECPCKGKGWIPEKKEGGAK